MAFTNNVMIVRHGLLAKLVKLWKENRLLEEIDRLPIELSPRKSKVIGRCCVTQGACRMEVQDTAAARIRYAGRGRRADPFVRIRQTSVAAFGKQEREPDVRGG